MINSYVLDSHLIKWWGVDVNSGEKSSEWNLHRLDLNRDWKLILTVTVNEMCSITHMTEELEGMNSMSPCNDPLFLQFIATEERKREARRWKTQLFFLLLFSGGQNYWPWERLEENGWEVGLFVYLSGELTKVWWFK